MTTIIRIAIIPVVLTAWKPWMVYSGVKSATILNTMVKAEPAKSAIVQHAPPAITFGRATVAMTVPGIVMNALMDSFVVNVVMPGATTVRNKFAARMKGAKRKDVTIACKTSTAFFSAVTVIIPTVKNVALYLYVMLLLLLLLLLATRRRNAP
jgi:hypothetical protein